MMILVSIAVALMYAYVDGANKEEKRALKESRELIDDLENDRRKSENVRVKLGVEIQELQKALWDIYRGSTLLVDQLRKNDLIPVWEPNGQLKKINGSLDRRASALKAFDDKFSKEGVKELYWILDVDYDNLPGSGKREKIISLLEFMDRSDRWDDLLKLAGEKAPTFNWRNLKI